MDIEEDINKINERFNNGTETIDDILNYCKNYRFTFENGTKMRLVEKKHVDRLIDEHKKLLAEREQDKKRIKELEEENRIFKNSNVLVNRYFRLKDNSIPKQKVKDKIEELKKDYEDSKDENGETEYYYPDYTIRKLEELLEEK